MARVRLSAIFVLLVLCFCCSSLVTGDCVDYTGYLHRAGTWGREDFRPWRVALHGNTACVVGRTSHYYEEPLMYFIDLADPRHPVDIGYTTPCQYDAPVEFQGSFAFLACGPMIYVYSVGEWPSVVAQFSLPCYEINDLVLDGDVLYAAGDRLFVIDVSDPLNLRLTNQSLQQVLAQWLAIDYPYAYTVTAHSVLRILDLRNPTGLRTIATLDLYDLGISRPIAALNGFVYLVEFNSLAVVDATDPLHPQLAGTLPMEYIEDVATVNGRLFVVTHSGLETYSLADPVAPVLIGRTGATDAQRLAEDSGTVVLADLMVGVPVIEASNPCSVPPIGIADLADASDVALFGSDRVVAVGRAQIAVFDMTDPASPVRIGDADLPARSTSVACAWEHAIVAADTAGLVVVDLSDPESPTLVGHLPALGSIEEVEVHGDHAFFGDGHSFRVADLSSPTSPAEVGRLELAGNARGVFVSEDLAYVVDGDGQLVIISVADPRAPRQIGSLPLLVSPNDVAVEGDFAYVGGYWGVDRVDVRDPARPVLAGSLPIDYAWRLSCREGLLYVGTLSEGLCLFDISTPTDPRPVGQINRGSERASVTDGRYVYLAAGGGGLAVFPAHCGPAAVSDGFVPDQTVTVWPQPSSGPTRFEFSFVHPGECCHRSPHSRHHVRG